MRVAFAGSKALGLKVLERLHAQAPESLAGILTIDDRADSRSRHDAFQLFGKRSGIAVNVAESRRESEEILRKLAPDCCFVVGWYWLFSKELLASVPKGFIGLHNSLLPRYRGFSPLVWTLINGESEAGFSVFSLSEEMDSGRLWAQDRVAVGPDDYVGDVLARIEDLAPTRVAEVYAGLLAGTKNPWAQPDSEATYCAQRLPEDGRIVWTHSAERIRNLVRALSDPYPGAFTVLDGDPLTVWRADLVGVSYSGIPGQVARVTPDGGVVVIAGDNRALVLREVDYRGKRAHAADMITSIRIRFPAGAP